MIFKLLKALGLIITVMGMGAVSTWLLLGPNPGQSTNPDHFINPSLVMVKQVPEKSEGLEAIAGEIQQKKAIGKYIPLADQSLEPEMKPLSSDRNAAPSNPPARRKRVMGEAKSAGQGLLAIVIDDIGHNLERTRDFLELKITLNFSVLPQLKHSRKSADLIRSNGREYIIHLPMEPFDYPRQNPGPLPLLLGQKTGVIKNRLASYFQELPHAIGASNHMGSAFSFDAARMGIIQKEVSRRKLFYLNSKTSSSPVPREIARNKGYRFLERDIFLDNEDSVSAIRGQLSRAMEVARRRGRAIAIGHPLKNTYRVLQEELVSASPERIKLVPLSTLLKK